MSEQTDKSSDGHAFVYSACVRIVLMFDYVCAYLVRMYMPVYMPLFNAVRGQQS